MAGNQGGALAAPDSLESLLGRIALGDEEAFEALYSRTVRRLFGLAVQVARKPELAEEIVQEVYAQVWSSAGRYDPARGKPLAWLLTLTHHRAVDVVRCEQSCLERESRHCREASALHQDTVEELILRRLENEKALMSLSMISSAQSEAIALAYFGGQTYAEVAKTLNLSVPAVKARIRDGFRNLRQLLEPAGSS